MALLIALTICAGQLAIPTVAAEVTETPIEGGTLTITVTEETATEETIEGETVTTTSQLLQTDTIPCPWAAC